MQAKNIFCKNVGTPSTDRRVNNPQCRLLQLSIVPAPNCYQHTTFQHKSHIVNHILHIFWVMGVMGGRYSTVVKVLCYKSEGRWFDPSWCHWNFHWHNPSDRTMALGSTQSLPGAFPGGKGGRCGRLTTLPPSCAVVMKFGNLNFLEPSGPRQACNGTAYLN